MQAVHERILTDCLFSRREFLDVVRVADDLAVSWHHHRLSEMQDSSEMTVQDDSILPVIAWFSKRDTMSTCPEGDPCMHQL